MCGKLPLLYLGQKVYQRPDVYERVKMLEGAKLEPELARLRDRYRQLGQRLCASPASFFLMHVSFNIIIFFPATSRIAGWPCSFSEMGPHLPTSSAGVRRAALVLAS
jgi:hypothetical protein